MRMLVVGRYVVGGGAFLLPRATGRAFGIDPAANPAATYVGRLFGIRAVTMAALLTTAADVDRDRQLRAGLGVDLCDAMAALLAGRRAELRPASATAACVAALCEAVLGARLIWLRSQRLSGGLSGGRAPRRR